MSVRLWEGRQVCGKVDKSVGRSASLSEKGRRHCQGSGEVVKATVTSSGKRRRHHSDVVVMLQSPSRVMLLLQCCRIGKTACLCVGLENQICYNGGAQGTNCNQYRFPHRHYVPPPPTAGGNLKNYIHLHHLSSRTHSHNRPVMTYTLQDWGLGRFPQEDQLGSRGTLLCHTSATTCLFVCLLRPLL